MSTQHSSGLRFWGKSSVSSYDLRTLFPCIPLGPSLRPQREWGPRRLSEFLMHGQRAILVCVLFVKGMWCFFISLSIHLLVFLEKQVAPMLLAFSFEPLVCRLFHQRVHLSRNISSKIECNEHQTFSGSDAERMFCQRMVKLPAFFVVPREGALWHSDNNSYFTHTYWPGKHQNRKSTDMVPLLWVDMKISSALGSQ